MIKKRRKLYFPILGFMVLFVATLACSTSTPTSVPKVITATKEANITLSSTDTIEPIIPTNVPAPTDIPAPTNTPKSTDTPSPTSTPLPPTVTPKPIKLSGSGDSIVDFENPFEIAIVHIKGNASRRYFGVTNYGSDGTQIDLLVNTGDPYDGIRPLDFRAGEQTTRFEVKASGKWEIEVLPISAARKLSVPGSIEGKGDDVFILNGSPPDLAKIKGNAASRYFGVIGYGTYSDLLVNTGDPYEGTVILTADTNIIEVKAVGAWSIEISSK